MSTRGYPHSRRLRNLANQELSAHTHLLNPIPSYRVRAGGEGVDRAVAAISEAFEKNPAILAAITSATEPGSRHDHLGRVTAMRRK